MGIAPLPRPVNYKLREVIFRGTILDEVEVFEEAPEVNLDYLSLIQHVEWEDGTHGIRFCYYFKPHEASDDAWRFANRPLTISVDALKELMKKALNKRWFRELIEN